MHTSAAVHFLGEVPVSAACTPSVGVAASSGGVSPAPQHGMSGK